jgi:hypothetical protein
MWWLLDHLTVFLLLVIIVLLILYIAWLRISMRASKARFALVVVAAQIVALTALLGLFSGPLPLLAINGALSIFGVEAVDSQRIALTGASPPSGLSLP